MNCHPERSEGSAFRGEMQIPRFARNDKGSERNCDRTSMILVFCGTPRFAVPTLERLVEATGKHAYIRTSQTISVVDVLGAGGLGPAEAGSRPRHAHQDRSLRSFESHGSSLLAERRLRPAANRLARVLPGRRMGRWTAARDWSQQRASGIVGTVRAQLVGPAVVGRNGGATLRGVERYAAGLEREHQWPHRR